MSEENSATWDRFDEDVTAQNCVHDAVETIWKETSFEISKKIAQQIVDPMVAEVAMYKLNQAVHVATVLHDGTFLPGEEVLEHLTPDDEPIPCAIDSWARGSVPARVVKVSETRFMDEMGLSDGTQTPSVSSFRSSSSRSRSTVSRALTSRGGHRHQNTHDETAPRIIELEDEHTSHTDVANMNATGHMYDMLQRQKHRMKQLTHTDDTVKDEFQLLQDEVNRAAEDLKGKNYLFDQNGNIVVVQPIKSDQLPPFSFNPSLSVNNDAANPTEEPKKKTAGNTTKRKKKIRVAGSRQVDESPDKPLFVPTTSLATTIAGTSHEILPNNGVAIETNKISKEGPPIPDDPRKPSRKEYFNRRNMASTSLDASWDEGFTDSGVNNIDSPNSSGFNDPSPTDRTGSITSKRYKDIDPLEGGRPKRSDASEKKSSRPTSEGLQIETKSGKQPPPIEPTKPSPVQQSSIDLLHGGSHMQGPRERLAPQVLHSRTDKKKYIVPARSTDEASAQSSVHSTSSKMSGTIKRENIANEIF